MKSDGEKLARAEAEPSSGREHGARRALRLKKARRQAAYYHRKIEGASSAERVRNGAKRPAAVKGFAVGAEAAVRREIEVAGELLAEENR